MKKINLFLSITILTLAFLFSPYLNVSAHNDIASKIQYHPSISIDSNETSDILDYETVLYDQSSLTTNPDGSITHEVTAETIIHLPVSEQIVSIQSSESKITTTDVKAVITINYDYNNGKIRINKVSGSWTPLVSLINISQREVHYHDGDLYKGHHGAKYPTQNTFSYTTGWPYVNYYPQDTTLLTGPRAFSNATVSVIGMTPHTISVFLTIEIM